MDFPTRTLYRSAIEDLSRGSGRTELDIASAAVHAAKQAAADAPAADRARRGDAGYILLSGGRRAFERAIGYRPPFRNWAARINRSVGVSGYLTAIYGVAAILLAAPLLVLFFVGVGPAALGLLGVLGAVPAVDAAVALGQSRSQRRICRDPSPGHGSRRRRPRRSAHARRRADFAHEPRPGSKS